MATVFVLGLCAGALHAQCPDGTPPPCASRPARTGAPAASPISVAVLSFENRSRDTADAFLAEGLSDEISTRLGQLGRLAVVSRSQVRRLHGADSLGIPAIGRALNASNLVTGSVQGSRTRLRVSVELLRSASATQVWSNVYDRGRTDLLEIQAEIATEVARLITGALRPGDRAALARSPTRSPEAYEHLLRGDVLAANRNPEGIVLALREYEAAIRLDPQSARAHASVAKAYSFCRDYACPLDIPTDTLAALAGRAAEAALRLDSTSADAWLGAAMAAYARLPADGRASLRAARRATVLDSTNAEAWHFLGWLSLLAGDDSAAVRAYRRALRADPGRGVSYEHLSRLSIIGHRFREARALLDSAIGFEPLYGFGYTQRAMLRAYLGDTTGARVDGERSAQLLGDSDPAPRVASLRAFALIQAGDTAGARALAERQIPLLRRSAAPTSPALGVAFVLMRVGRVDDAMHVLGLDADSSRRAVGAASVGHVGGRTPLWDPVRGNRYFERMVAVSAEPWRGATTGP
jgi:TolB-like protein